MPPSQRASFRVAGFPVHVRPGFVMFMVLIVLLNLDRPSFGLWLAALMAAFTLLHELGHAIAARSFGCRAEISLDFLAGYAAFVPARPLRRWERAVISAAGPFVQIAIGLAVYVALGGGLSSSTAGATGAQFAALWAGPVIGVFNLLPILPFDGGAILHTVVDWVTPRHSKRIMYGFTLAVAAVGIAYMASRSDLQPLIVFAIVPLLSVAQSMRADRDRSLALRRQRQLQDAEAMAWATGRVDQFGQLPVDALTPTPVVPSPWFRAAQHLRAGHDGVARDILLADLHDSRPHPDTWWPPDMAPTSELASLVDLLPDLGAAGRPWSTAVLCQILIRLGRHHDAGRLAAAAFRHQPSGSMALVVARAAAMLDDRATAVAWLGAAAGHLDSFELDAAIAASPELRALRDDPAVSVLLD